MARKITDKNIQLDPAQDGGLTSSDIIYVGTQSVKDKLDKSTLPLPSLGEDLSLLQSYYVTPDEFGDEFDGAASASGQINEYSYLTTDVTAGSVSIVVAAVTPDMVAGREIMLHQTQAFRDIASKFKYEFVRIESVDIPSKTLTLQTGLVNDYYSDNTGDKEDNTMTQVVTVPNYSTLTLTGTLAAQAWDGQSGGIIAFRAKVLSGSAGISTSSAGFRGGRYRVPNGIYSRGGDWNTFSEGPLGKYGHDKSAPPVITRSEYRSQILTLAGNTGLAAAATGSNLTQGGELESGTLADIQALAAAPYTHNGGPLTEADFEEVLPMAVGGVGLDSNSNNDYWQAQGNNAGGIICCFVEDVSLYSGTVTSNGGQSGSYTAGAGGTIRFQTPSDPGYTGTFTTIGATASVLPAVGGSGGHTTGAGSNPAVAGWLIGPKVDQDLQTTDSPTFANITSTNLATDPNHLPKLSQVEGLVNTAGAFPVTQNGHGFTEGDAIYNNAGIWAKAQADNRDTLAVAIVDSVDTVDVFRYRAVGPLTLTGHLYTVGEFLYVSDAVAGALTETEPVGLTLFSNPVAYVIDENTILVIPTRPSNSLPRSNDLRGRTVSDSTYNVQDTDECIYVDAALNPVSIVLPQGPEYEGFTVKVKKVDVSANAVTVSATSGTVEFGATYVITTQGSGETFSSHNDNYYAVP
jgi:hypothetical protein